MDRLSASEVFHKAAREGDTDTLEIMLDSGISVDIPGKFGQTPLMVAILFKNFPAAHYLVQKGADVNVIDLKGRTPVLVASLVKSGNFIRILLDAGAKLPAEERQRTTVLELLDQASPYIPYIQDHQ